MPNLRRLIPDSITIQVGPLQLHKRIEQPQPEPEIAYETCLICFDELTGDSSAFHPRYAFPAAVELTVPLRMFALDNCDVPPPYTETYTVRIGIRGFTKSFVIAWKQLYNGNLIETLMRMGEMSEEDFDTALEAGMDGGDMRFLFEQVLPTATNPEHVAAVQRLIDRLERDHWSYAGPALTVLDKLYPGEFDTAEGLNRQALETIRAVHVDWWFLAFMRPKEQ